MSMHTSANDGPGLYENQTAYSLQRGPRSLTRETEEEEMTEFRKSRMNDFSCEKTKVRVGP